MTKTDKAEQYYKLFMADVSGLIGNNNSLASEGWYTEAMEFQVELKQELEQKEEDDMDEEEKAVHRAIQPAIDAARAQFADLSSTDFIIYLNDNIVPEDKRISMPYDDTRTN